MFLVFKFVLDLLYDGALVFGSLYIVNQVMQVLKYFIQTQHEEKMARLNNEFYHQDRLLR